MSTEGDNRVTVESLAEHLWAVEVHGEHDMRTAPMLREALHHVFAAGSRVVVDLSSASFIDSTVLSNLVDARLRSMEAEDDAVVIVAPYGSFAEKLLRVSGLNERIAVFPDRPSAIAALSSAGD
jgi:anti-anti-sigma factor